MNLDVYGGAYRCLLRLHENAGNPVMSEQHFASTYLPYTNIQVEPSAWNLPAIRDTAAALGLAQDIRISKEYAQILADHQAGHAVLVRVKGDSFWMHSSSASDYRITVLETMDEQMLIVRCPMRNETWELLPPIDRSHWKTIDALGLTLCENSRINTA